MAFRRGGDRFPEKDEKKVIFDRDSGQSFRLEYEPIASTSKSSNTYRIKKVPIVNTKPAAPVTLKKAASSRIPISRNPAYEEKLQIKNRWTSFRKEVFKLRQENEWTKRTIDAEIQLFERLNKICILLGMPPSAELVASMKNLLSMLKSVSKKDKQLKELEELLKGAQTRAGCTWNEVHQKY